MTTIEMVNIKKQYNKNTFALKDVSLKIGVGIHGLLGRNGSGKTTLMRILTTLLQPTDGIVRILDLDCVEHNYLQIKQSIGYLPQEFGFYKGFTVEEVMEYMYILKDLDKQTQRECIDNALHTVNLSGERGKKYRQLSGGMKRRLGLAQAMLGDPEILIVDEPTAGVDPEERIKIRNLLSGYGQEHTVLFSTHIVEDIEHTCENLSILDEGKLIYSGTVAELLKEAKNHIWTTTFSNSEDFNDFKQKNKVLSFRRMETGFIATVVSNLKPTMQSVESQVSLEEAYVYMTMKGDAK